MDGLLNRDGLFKDERSAFGLKIPATAGTADDDKRHGVVDRAVLQPVQESSRSRQVKIDNKSVNFRLGQLGLGALRFRLYIYSNVQTTENALEHADFLQVARDHHG